MVFHACGRHLPGAPLAHADAVTVPPSPECQSVGLRYNVKQGTLDLGGIHFDSKIIAGYFRGFGLVGDTDPQYPPGSGPAVAGKRLNTADVEAEPVEPFRNGVVGQRDFPGNIGGLIAVRIGDAF